MCQSRPWSREPYLRSYTTRHASANKDRNPLPSKVIIPMIANEYALIGRL